MRSVKSSTLILFVAVAAVFAPQFAVAQYSISTVAGGGPNNLAALQASVGIPESIAFDSNGNAYIAESYASQILKVTPSGTVTVVAGNGTPGYAGDGGPATSAALGQFGPQGVFVDSAGNIYISDTYNSVIRVVNQGTQAVTIANVTIQPGDIQTVVGVNYDSSGGSACQYGGDGNPASSAYLCDPYGVFVDGSGNIFIADFGNAIIREVTASNGYIQTVAGTPTVPCDEAPASTVNCGDGNPATSGAYLDQPAGVFVDGSGNIFIADTFDSAIRVVNPGAQAVTIANVVIPAGSIETVAGVQYDPAETVCQYSGDGGAAISAYLCEPYGVFVDSSENIFIADWGNNAIREVFSTGTSAGDISSVVNAAPGASCQNYTVTPPSCGDGGLATSATLNNPSAVYVDASEDIFIADSEDFEIREVTASNGNIQPFAGNSFEAYSGDGGLPTSAELNTPGNLFVDVSGNVYIADTSNSVIRFINNGTSAVTIAGTTIQPGDISTVAGNGTPGYSGDGSAPTSAQLNFPQGVFADAQGDIFIADSANDVIRFVNNTASAYTIPGTTTTIAPGTIGTVVGNGTLCTNPTPPNPCGDGLAPTSAQLNDPLAVAVDISGNIFIADTDDDAIRVVNVGTAALTFGPQISVAAGTILTVAGTLTLDCDTSAAPANCGDGGLANAAYLFQPAGVTLDAQDDIFIADTQNNAIREVSVSTGIIQTVAGTDHAEPGFSGDNGLATLATLNSPSGVWIDESNDIFIADSENDAIREVVAATGFIQTIAGIPAKNGFPTPGFSGDGGPATSAELDFPSGIFGASTGKLYIADTNNSRIRQLGPGPLTVSVAPSTATVVVGDIQQYTAAVTGNLNTSVTWYVNQVQGGNTTVGTISTTGLFTAPAAVPSPATVTITAVSQVDNTTSGTATATISLPSSTITVTVTTNPVITQVNTSQTQAFMASVTGSTNMAVNWYVEGEQGGSATFGTIDTNGNYTAPTTVPSPATIVIEAVSQADPTAIGTESVTIVAAPSAAPPAPQTVSPGGTANYSLSLKPNAGYPTITLSCLQDSLPSGAICTFSQNGTTITTITPSSTAVPFSLAVSVPSTAASLQKSSGSWFGFYFAVLPLAGFLVFCGNPRRSRKAWPGIAMAAMLCALLFGLSACGGSSGGSTGSQPVTYNIKIQGATAAQPNPVTITTASLTVQ